MPYPKQLTRIFYGLIAANLIVTIGALAQQKTGTRDDVLTSLVQTENISPAPFQVGEKFTYKVKIRRLPAGKRTDLVVKKTQLNGKNVYHIRSEAKTHSIFRLYHFRNQQETFLQRSTPLTDMEKESTSSTQKCSRLPGLSPVRFQNRIEDRKYRATVTANFGIDDAIEYQKTSRLNPKSPQKRETKVLSMPNGTQDELSMLYFLRSKKLAIGKTYFFPLLAQGKIVKVNITVQRRESLKTKVLGTVKTLVLHASNGSQLWLTDDTRRIPVKIEAQSKIGKMVANLEKVEFAK